jgi:hypothetical protein
VRRPGLLALVGVALAAAAALAAGADIRITPVETADHRVFASFACGSAYTPEVREAVQSGLPTTFTFIVDLRRPSTLWFDRTLGTTTVAATVRFDNLTRLYQVAHLTEGRVDWSRRTGQEDEMRTWATEFERVALSDGEALEANVDYYVRVRVRSSPHRSFFLWPWGHDDADARASIKFIR